MKTMRITCIVALMFCSATMPVLAQQNFEKGKPGNDNYRYLDEYHNLKEYIDYNKYPNFKLGIGTTVSSYLNDSKFRSMVNSNFTETVAGNAMKMSSCVDANGNMNFTTVKNYVNTATAAGLNVYGHTLAWHSQQAIGWLRKLVADLPAPELTEYDVIVYEPVASQNYCTKQSVGWTSDQSQYGYKISFDATNGMNVHCTKIVQSWEVQFVSLSDIATTPGKTYRMTMTVRGSKAGKLHTRLGDWSSGASADVAFTTEWKEVSVNYTPTLSSCFYMIQCGDFTGDIYIKNIRFEEPKKGQTMTDERRCLKVHSTAKNSQEYDNQMWFVPGSFAAGSKYVFTAQIRADKKATVNTQIHNAPGSYVHYEAIGNISFDTNWKTITLSGTMARDGQSIALNLNTVDFENNYYFDNVSFKINGVEKIKNGDFESADMSSFKVKEYGSAITTPTVTQGFSYVYVPKTIPLSKEVRHDTLVYAMDKWIKGMMQACNGKVKAWDLVNEAISGGGDNGYGYYTLQHTQGYNPDGTWDVGGDAFYWQDYMGDLEYVRQACRIARKYGPEDVVLFINDYNLESDWDNNKKLRSLIHWVEQWESDGVTHIDGLGTQMHISFYKNSTTQASKKQAISNMFRLMAATGKYVRVSELDMGYVDINGNKVETANMTESQHKEMASFYEWIIKEYLSLVPPAQQWGICQWCPTDAPANSGWRANEPVGIWDLNNYRKHVYAGFVRGLGGQLYTGVDAICPAPIETAIYDLTGRKYPSSTDPSDLPAGIYIIGNRKILIK